ncbi:MAG: acyl-ACP desaturase [Chloroflexota bacterium]|nr:acyl-ACP desaturase [Chloroflexota bacterium]
MANIISTPLTMQGKLIAIQKEMRENYESYFKRAAIHRMWFPDHLTQRNEMAKLGHMITENTKEILLGFLGVESVVDDYVFEGIKGAGDSIATRELYMQWGFEERRHGQTFRHSLIDSGLYTQEFVDKYLDEVNEHHWTFEEQTGYEGNVLLASAYAIFQERHTRWNYTNIRKTLWEEYGSPRDDQGRRVDPAVAGAIRFPETDEGAHEANFINIVAIHMKYLPDLAMDALAKVSKHYTMPVVQLPNGDEFLRAILAAGLGKARDIMNEIMTPSINRFGLESRQALKRAVNGFNSLPEDAIVKLHGKDIEGVELSEDSKIYELQENGKFILLGNSTA